MRLRTEFTDLEICLTDLICPSWPVSKNGPKFLVFHVSSIDDYSIFIIWRKIIAIINATFAVVKRKREKKIQSPAGFGSSAMRVQRSTN